MRSNKRQRARARLATSKPVNVMFSNGLGVCKIPNAGSRSICRNKTREISIPEPSLKIIQQAIQLVNDVTFKISTNIVDATMTISNAGGLTLTAPSPAKSVYGDQTLTLNQATAANNTYSAVKLTLTGGRTVGRGTSPHIVSSVTLNSFTVDTVLPVVSSSSIQSNNTVNTSYARPNNTVTFRITADESISQPVVAFKSGGDPVSNTVTYGGAPANAAGPWTAAYIVDANDTEGLVTMDYTIQDLLGNTTSATGAAPSDGSSVTVDKTAPTLNNGTSSVETATPTKITLRFSESLALTTGLAPTDFVVKENGAIKTINSVGIVGVNCELTMSAAILTGTNVTVDYIAPLPAVSPGLRDFAGIGVASFNNQSIDNNV